MTDVTRRFHFQWRDEEPDLRSAVLQAIGAASMCWTELPRGVFKETLAIEIADVLIEWIKENCDDD